MHFEYLLQSSFHLDDRPASVDDRVHALFAEGIALRTWWHSALPLDCTPLCQGPRSWLPLPSAEFRSHPCRRTPRLSFVATRALAPLWLQKSSFDTKNLQFLLLTGRSILLDECANVKILVRDVTTRGSMSACVFQSPSLFYFIFFYFFFLYFPFCFAANDRFVEIRLLKSSFENNRDFLPPEMRVGAVPSTPDATLTYLFGFFLAMFATPSSVAFLRPTTVNLTYDTTI